MAEIRFGSGLAPKMLSLWLLVLLLLHPSSLYSVAFVNRVLNFFTSLEVGQALDLLDKLTDQLLLLFGLKNERKRKVSHHFHNVWTIKA